MVTLGYLGLVLSVLLHCLSNQGYTWDTVVKAFKEKGLDEDRCSTKCTASKDPYL